ncbi:MAG TPA: 2-dehydro-3-deoxygluconokinase [Planctomycetes bacterium]|nr:2-dehydro-3-deoxygluconokinase [Planctomycetota bacterium]
MTKRFVAFGELLLRLDVKDHARFVQAEEFAARWTGAEANVAVSLACFGWEAWVASKAPDHEIGQACIDEIRRHGVRTEHVARGGERLGLLYVEQGASQRPTKVIYDRRGSSFSEASPEDFDWERILDGKDWLHFSGTGPALGAGVRRIIEEGLAAAHRRGLTVSFDPNYRAKLWSVEEAGRALRPLLSSADVFIGSPYDASLLFGIETEAGLAPREMSAQLAAELCRRFGLRAAAMTLRGGDSASANDIAGLLCAGGRTFSSREYRVEIVDRIGTGDAFAAGVIHGLGRGWEPQAVIDFAAAAACLKHSIPGDFNLATEAEVLDLVRGGGGGRVAR